MRRQVFAFTLALSLKLFGQDCGCYIPDGQVIYSEICCPTVMCPPECPNPCSPFPAMVVDLQLGVRRDALKFSVAGDHGRPHHLIRQKYKKVQSIQGAVNVWVQANEDWYFRGFADYAAIVKGREKLEIHDADGASEYEHSKRLKKNGYCYDFLGGVGYILPFCCFRYTNLAVVGGYSREGQIFKVRGDRGELRASWTGPWVGSDFAIRYAGLKIGATCEYHWAKFRATGHQIGDTDCVGECDLTNGLHANGWGLVGVLSVTQTFCDNWRFGFVGKGQWWRTHSGRYSSGSDSFHLKSVHWESFSLVADLGYRF